MKKKTKYLDFYMKCMKRGVVLPQKTGLCALLPAESIEMFHPTRSDCEEYGINRDWWWAGATSKEPSGYSSRGIYNETRQTITLFLAAMNNEL